MEYLRNKNIITITLSDDESATMDYVDSISGIFFSNFFQNFLNGRKSQHEDDLKQGLLQNITREQLLKASELGIDKIIAAIEASEVKS